MVTPSGVVSRSFTLASFIAFSARFSFSVPFISDKGNQPKAKHRLLFDIKIKPLNYDRQPKPALPNPIALSIEASSINRDECV